MSWIILIFVLLVASIKNRGTKAKLRVSVVIPAYNEEKTVGKVVSVVKSLNYVDEVIVVDDGSKDKTAQSADEAGAIVIIHKENKGKGSAIKTGFDSSTGDIVAFIDADLHNLSKDQVENIIKPILEGKADVTKTKFRRKAGRVTELTAKPLLNFFFPEIKFDQPLSGQFAAKRSFLSRIKLEEDYGVDVGIVLDADVRGMRIKEVDIGKIDHSHSPIESLNKMANEVVRTIVDRAMEYGRVSMMDTLGKYIRMSILGLSLTSLGLFSIFFINRIPAWSGIIMVIIGTLIAVYYTAKLVKMSFGVLRRSDRKSPTVKSFIYMHFPILISALILLAMIFTFVGSVHVTESGISVQPASSNLVWKAENNSLPLDVRGPYTVDSALEEEYDILRVPVDVLSTLEVNYGDTIYIKGQNYTITPNRLGEDNILRIPADARTYLGLEVGTVLLDNNIRNTFKNLYVEKSLPIDGNINNSSIKQGSFIKTSDNDGRIVNIYIDEQKVATTKGVFENGTYSIYINNFKYKTIYVDEDNSTSYAYWGKYVIKIEIGDKTKSNMEFATSDEGKFLNLIFK
ncbi:glycosyltransferase [Methanobacterium oryzae]|uniref:glycosyltransferase n=1 Tax=Methanobacterium oryzae TaxID=69540 RepID=UPI003D1AB533